MEETDYQAIMFGQDEPQFIYTTRAIATSQLYLLGVLEHWLPVLVPSGPGFSCV